MLLTRFRILRRWAKRFLIMHGAAKLVARWYTKKFVVVAGSPEPGPSTLTLVALNPDRFRGELEVLVNSGIRVLRAPYAFQQKLLGLFFEKGDQVLTASKDPVLMARRTRMHKVLTDVIQEIYPAIGIDGTIGAALHYIQDLEWGAVSDKLGYPYIVLHRENLAASQAIIEFHEKRGAELDPFTGSKLIFHNDIMRRAFIRSGYVSSDKALTTGAMRMDYFCSRGQIPFPTDRRKQITLFSFGPGAGVLHARPPHWPEDSLPYLDELCYETHRLIMVFAQEHPEVDVVIKPKFGGRRVEKLYQIWRDAGLDPNQAPNLRITEDADAQALIEQSHVVISFASTTLLEAAIMGRNVIVPMFAEAKDPEWQKWLFFLDDLDIFDCPESSDQFLAYMAKGLENENFSPSIMARRLDVFAKYICPLDGSATQKTVQVIQDVIKKRKLDESSPALPEYTDEDLAGEQDRLKELAS